MTELERLQAENKELRRHLAKKAGSGMIEVSSLVSSTTGLPRISFEWDELKTQLDPAIALGHAQGVIEAIAFAWADSFLVQFMREKVGLDEQRAVAMLVEFRKFRETHDATKQ